jgi:nucleoside-diphosphate-sugar epimerase
VRDYIPVDDTASAVIPSLSAGVPHTLNVGTGVGTSLLQTLRLLEQVSGRALEHLPAGGFDVGSIVFDAGAFRVLSRQADRAHHRSDNRLRLGSGARRHMSALTSGGGS